MEMNLCGLNLHNTVLDVTAGAPKQLLILIMNVIHYLNTLKKTKTDMIQEQLTKSEQWYFHPDENIRLLRYYQRSMEFNNKVDNLDDLFQVGCLGLVKAIDNFDTSYNVTLSTYACPMTLSWSKIY